MSSVTPYLERHPNMQNVLRSLVALFYYIFEGHIIVDLGRWIVLYCGRVSETAMLLATLWVTATFVTPELTSKLGTTAILLSSLSMIAFSLLPEVILFSAIIKTLKHWQAVLQNKKSGASWAWAMLYTLPTATFFGMTVYTIGSFVSTSGHLQTATGGALVLRCLAGWFYSLVGLIHAGLPSRRNDQNGAEVERNFAEMMRQQMDVHRAEIERLHASHKSELQETITRLETQFLERVQSLSTSVVTPLEEETIQETISSSELVIFDTALPNTEANNFTFFECVSVPARSEHYSEQEQEDIPEQESEPTSEREQDTEPLSVPNTQATKSVRSTSKKKRTLTSASEQKVRAFLKRNPNAGPTLIAKQTGISKSYVSELIAKVKQSA